ncbi:MAG: low-specificity L-threonine aldolase [Pirellulales bacterium]
MIDLRSDTVTRPTPGMIAAIAKAEVGDDVIDKDPTVEALQELTAEILGKQAAIFMPSGTMTNQIAIRVHCQPGDEFICDENCHIYNYEQGAYAQLSGLATRTIPGIDGVMHVDQMRDLIRPDNEHMCRTRLVCLENTHNRGGGRVWPYDQLAEVCLWAHEEGLKTHLDGARLFNAVAATGIQASQWSDHFDSVSICFSKGLGAPVGSCLAGSEEFIRQARRARKLFGGGMRQAGIIAAGALYALQHHRERLVDDHVHAKMLADTIRNCKGLKLVPEQVDSNIVIFEVEKGRGSTAGFMAALEAKGVRALAMTSTRIRLVTHLDVDRPQIEKACQAIREITAGA